MEIQETSNLLEAASFDIAPLVKFIRLRGSDHSIVRHEAMLCDLGRRLFLSPVQAAFAAAKSGRQFGAETLKDFRFR